MVLHVEVYPKRPRKKSKAAVPEGNGFVPQDGYHVMLEEITLEKLRRIMSEALDKAFNEPTEKIRESRQRLAGLEQNTQQRCLAMGTDVKVNTKTRKRAEDAAAGQAKHGDSCFAKRVQVSPTSSTSFGMKAELPALLRRGDIFVKKGATAPKPRPSPLERCAN